MEISQHLIEYVLWQSNMALGNLHNGGFKWENHLSMVGSSEMI